MSEEEYQMTVEQREKMLADNFFDEVVQAGHILRQNTSLAVAKEVLYRAADRLKQMAHEADQEYQAWAEKQDGEAQKWAEEA